MSDYDLIGRRARCEVRLVKRKSYMRREARGGRVEQLWPVEGFVVGFRWIPSWRQVADGDGFLGPPEFESGPRVKAALIARTPYENPVYVPAGKVELL